MEIWNDEFRKRLEDSKEFHNVLEYLNKFTVPEKFSLDTSYINVMMLIDFMEVIEKNSNQLKNSFSLEHLKKHVKPSAILVDYIMLEISNFYSKVHKMKKEGSLLLELPSYWEIIRDYRNLMPGHRDKDHELKTLADYTSSIKILDSIGIPKIVDDFIEYYKKINIDSLPNN